MSFEGPYETPPIVDKEKSKQVIPNIEVEAKPDATEVSGEQSKEQVAQLNETTRLEVKRAKQEYEQLQSKVDELLTAHDLSTQRKGKKIYTGFEGMREAINDSEKILKESPEDPGGAMADIQNNILGFIKSKMEILYRDAGFALEHIDRAKRANRDIVDPEQRKDYEKQEWISDAEDLYENSQEILRDISKLEAGGARSVAELLAEPAEESGDEVAARREENKGLKEIGW